MPGLCQEGKPAAKRGIQPRRRGPQPAGGMGEADGLKVGRKGKADGRHRGPAEKAAGENNNGREVKAPHKTPWLESAAS